jgi:hypothetical protein
LTVRKGEPSGSPLGSLLFDAAQERRRSLAKIAKIAKAGEGNHPIKRSNSNTFLPFFSSLAIFARESCLL